MAKLNVAPTKSNLLAIKEQLAISTEGYDLLEQKREILVMELMKVVERVRLLEADIDKCIAKAYPSLKNMLMNVGGEKAELIRNIVLFGVLVYELLGPMLTRSSLKSAGEIPEKSGDKEHRSRFKTA